MIVTKTTMHCDRCGKEIKAHNPYYTVNITPEYFRLITHKINKIYELCPDCHKWLKNGITNESEENNGDSD